MNPEAGYLVIDTNLKQTSWLSGPGTSWHHDKLAGYPTLWNPKNRCKGILWSRFLALGAENLKEWRHPEVTIRAIKFAIGFRLLLVDFLPGSSTTKAWETISEDLESNW